VRRVTLWLAVGLLATACGSSGPSLGGARTYYESLDLSTPRRAVTTLVDAFGRNDFMTVWLVLDPFAQDEFRSNLNLVRYSQILDTAAFPDYQTALQTEFLPMASWDSHDLWYLFDSLMLLADRHQAFLIDLSGPVEITGETTEGPFDYTDVTARVAGIEGEVTFRMSQAPSGRWRVFQVIVPGGDTRLVPWAVPTTG
jgi:hypothetical protein